MFMDYLVRPQRAQDSLPRKTNKSSIPTIFGVALFQCIVNIFSGFTFYKMSNLDNRIANADQLLTQDVDRFCEGLVELYSNLSKVFQGEARSTRDFSLLSTLPCTYTNLEVPSDSKHRQSYSFICFCPESSWLIWDVQSEKWQSPNNNWKGNSDSSTPDWLWTAKR